MGLISMIKSVPAGVVKAYGKAVTNLSKNKPQIMVYGGLMVATAGFVWAVVNATKLPDQMKISEAKVDEINQKKENATNPALNGGASEEETAIIVAQCDKDLRKAKVDTAVMIFKLVGVPSLVFISGIGLGFAGHIELVRRFGQLSMAYASLQDVFKRYRQLNIQEHGEECDRRYRYGITGETETTAEVTDENGHTKQVKCKIPIVGDEGASLYRFCFSEDFSRKCPKDPVRMISFLQCQERFWNTWMETHRKPVTLYMVLNDLGIELDPDDPRNDYVMIAGWRPNGDGDNCIDFGIMRAVNKPALDMLENVCYLDFNCDGNLYHSPRYGKDGRKICA